MNFLNKSSPDSIEEFLFTSSITCDTTLHPYNKGLNSLLPCIIKRISICGFMIDQPTLSILFINSVNVEELKLVNCKIELDYAFKEDMKKCKGIVKCMLNYFYYRYNISDANTCTT